MRRYRLEGSVLPKDLLLSKNLSGMILRLNLLWTNDTFDNSVFVDDKRGAESTHVSAPVHLLLTIDAEVLTSFKSVSAMRGKGSSFFSINFLCDFSSWMLTPMMA